MANRDGGRAPRQQLGDVLLIGGLASFVGTPIVYRLRAAAAHVHTTRSWWWPTWWMLVPLLIVLLGAFLDGCRPRYRRPPD